MNSTYFFMYGSPYHCQWLVDQQSESGDSHRAGRLSGKASMRPYLPSRPLRLGPAAPCPGDEVDERRVSAEIAQPGRDLAAVMSGVGYDLSCRIAERDD